MRRTPIGGLRPALIVLLAVLAVSFASPAAATTRDDSLPLRPGSYGQRVSDLQWLLAGHRPNVFTQVKPTFRHPPNRSYGARTVAALTAYRFRIGFPRVGQCGAKTNLVSSRIVSGYFFNLLEGKAQRPRCWVALAAQRVKGLVRTGATQTALAIQKLEVSQLGIHEVPDGSNRGPCISFTCTLAGRGYGPYQGSTGAFGAAWCASFAQWALVSVTGHRMTAPLPAFVPSIADWAQRNGFLAAKPKAGSFVVFLSPDLRLVNAFHIGFVVRVTATGVQTIEGNYSNGVHEVWRPFNANRMVYVDVPGVA